MEKVFLEYSPKQKATHITSEEEMFENNKNWVLGKANLDNYWLPIASGTWKEMALLGAEIMKNV